VSFLEVSRFFRKKRKCAGLTDFKRCPLLASLRKPYVWERFGSFNDRPGLTLIDAIFVIFNQTDQTITGKMQVWSKCFLDIVRDIRTAYAGNFSHLCCFDTEIGRLSRNVKLGVRTLWSKSAFDLISQVWTIINFMLGLKNHCPKWCPPTVYSVVTWIFGTFVSDMCLWYGTVS
jgi:hypothetical protein